MGNKRKHKMFGLFFKHLIQLFQFWGVFFKKIGVVQMRPNCTPLMYIYIYMYLAIKGILAFRHLIQASQWMQLPPMNDFIVACLWTILCNWFTSLDWSNCFWVVNYSLNYPLDVLDMFLVLFHRLRCARDCFRLILSACGIFSRVASFMVLRFLHHEALRWLGLLFQGLTVSTS